jgi:hypothetical protein
MSTYLIYMSVSPLKASAAVSAPATGGRGTLWAFYSKTCGALHVAPFDGILTTCPVKLSYCMYNSRIDCIHPHFSIVSRDVTHPFVDATSVYRRAMRKKKRLGGKEAI